MEKHLPTYKPRIVWIDNARFFAIFTVVLYHVVSMLAGENLPGYRIFKGIVAGFNMPIFFIISGYLSSNKLTYSESNLIYVRKNIKSWCLHLLLPAYVFTILIMPFDKEASHNPTIYFWFLHSLFRLYLIILLSNHLVSSLTQNSFIRYTCIIVITYVCSYIIGNMSFEFATYILLGVFAKKIELFEKLNITQIFILLLLGIMLLFWIWDHSLYVDKAKILLATSPLTFIARQACGICLGLFFISIIKSFCKEQTCLTNIGTITLGIYLIHDYIIEFILKGYFHFGFNFTEFYQWVFLITCSIIIFAVISRITFLIKKNKWARLILLGETK